MATTSMNRHTLCTCSMCTELDPIGQWIPTTTSLSHERMARRMNSPFYQRGRGRATVTGSRARRDTLRGGRGATSNLLRGSRGRPPTRSGAVSIPSSVPASIPTKRVRTTSPLNTLLRDEALESSTTPFDDLVPADIDYLIDGPTGRLGVEDLQDLTKNFPHSADLLLDGGDDAPMRQATISDERAQLNTSEAQP
ncbi:hypothetical protein BD310DRAFT_923723 [Dichomitus squalens]|uniref:Uncharacterized protein n=1 Tax=Dichomitus squalens TaxID=114155 RepID=A0A4Q9PZJ5_9APHY|nr:hypothetical protein BD310DRAFT_923723 [Dichomitus squalens]